MPVAYCRRGLDRAEPPFSLRAKMDGSQVAFHGDSAGSGIQNLQTETAIDLSQVVSVVMPDGTELKVPEA